ncbi:MAG: NAD-dependent epimerase/dehydratase family protein [Candidatus Eutrophobiaceae bacterium]
MHDRPIAILGGTGFVGVSLCNRLAKAGRRLRVFTRQREARRQNLILLPEMDLVELDVHDPAALREGLDGCSAAINLVGILHERGSDGRGFHRAHVELAEKLLAACRDTGIKRILQLSSLGADRDSQSRYLSTKGQAVDLLHGNPHGIAISSYYPSIIFGARDQFFNHFAQLLRCLPVFPVMCPNAQLCPVYVLDVVEMMVRTLDDPKSHGQRFRICGPSQYAFIDLVRYVRQLLKIRRLIISLPDGVSQATGKLFDFLSTLPGGGLVQKPFSLDAFHALRSSKPAPPDDLIAHGIHPTALEAVVPAYLLNKTQRGSYVLYRDSAYKQEQDSEARDEVANKEMPGGI